MKEYTCKRCDKEFNSYESLRKHVGRIHKINTVNFRVEFLLNDKWPVCNCGCGQKVKWSNEIKNFREYCAGHQSRVHNNWGHNPTAVAKSADTRRRQFASGERIMWSKGQSVLTNPSLQSAAKKLSERYTEEIKSEYSKRMSRMRKDGTIPTLYREESSQWKGGISTVNNLCRNDKRLYTEWKYPILIRDGFKCTECLNTTDLQVHHDDESFSDILKKLITIDDLEKQEDFERKKLICDKITDYHVQNKVSGKTLCRSCHGKIHPSLNF